MPNTLIQGTEYTKDQLEDIFDFEYKKPAGIKKTAMGDIVLFSNEGCYSDYHDEDIFNYEGQRTGSGDQKLIFGNKDLYDIYENDNVKNIYLFINYEFAGQYVITENPYKENGSWRFPLSKK